MTAGGRAGTPPRSLARHFQATTGTTPLRGLRRESAVDTHIAGPYISPGCSM